MKKLKRESPTRMRRVSFPLTLPLAPRSPKGSTSEINARMPTPYAFPGPLTFEDPDGSRDETEDRRHEGTEGVLMTSNAKLEGAGDSEFEVKEEDLIVAKSGERSRQETWVEITKIVLNLHLGNGLKGLAEFNILPWDPTLEAAYLSGKSEDFFKRICSAVTIAALEIIPPPKCTEQRLNLTSAVEEALKDVERTDATETEELLGDGDCSFVFQNIDDSRRFVFLKCNILSSASSTPAEFCSLVKDNLNSIICSEVAADVSIKRPPMSSREVENKKLKIHHTRETTKASSAGESAVIPAKS